MRRTAVLLLGLAGLAGCGSAGPEASGAEAWAVASEPFTVGVPGDFERPGVTLTHASSHGVALVNNRGMLVALALRSPGTGRRLRYDKALGQFVGPEGERYTSDGLPLGDSVDGGDRLALERCRIDLALSVNGEPRRIVVDPTVRLVFEANQWSDARGYVDVPKALAGAARAAADSAMR